MSVRNDVVVPHFDLPFRFGGRSVVEVEQGTLPDLSNCVYIIVVCPQGWRDEVPDFGTPDLTFDFIPAINDRMKQLIQDQEPRTQLTFTETQGADELARAIKVAVNHRTGGK